MSLTVDQLTRTFNGNAGIHKISFNANKGEIIGLLGKSGSGKSTLLRTISGLDTDFQGEIRVHNHLVKGPQPEIGVVFQEARLFPWLTVIENVLFSLQNKTEDDLKKAKRLLYQVDLEDAENLYPKQLSGGMAQRVSIARALVSSPGLLLLDEPFSALDAFTKMQLQDLLLNMCNDQQLTTIIVTHDIDEALYLCDRIILLANKPGKVEAEIEIHEAKPRNRGSAYLAEQKSYILSRLHI